MNRAVFALGSACVLVGVVDAVGAFAVPMPGGTYGFLAASALVAIAAGVVLRADVRDGVSVASDDLGGRDRPRSPGLGATRTIESLRVVGRRDDASDGRRALTDRIEALAVDVLTANRDCTEATAREQLRTGTWTTDGDAAAFFRDGTLPALSVRDQFVALRTGDPPFARRARRCLAELHRIEVEADDVHYHRIDDDRQHDARIDDDRQHDARIDDDRQHEACSDRGLDPGESSEEDRRLEHDEGATSPQDPAGRPSDPREASSEEVPGS